MEAPPSLIAVLRKWKEVRTALFDLIGTANPNAIAAGDLNLALLKPDQPESKIMIERYRKRYASMIDERVQPAFDTVHQIDEEVERLLGVATQGESQPTLPRSNILELCRKLADQLAGLKALASLGESDG
jgi:hypothetical protein